MGIGTFVHHIGTFLLFVATILLIVVSISAPVIDDISLLKVKFHDTSKASGITFGTFGYCILDANGGGNDCSKTHLGYNPGAVAVSLDPSIDISQGEKDAANALTRVMVLHPVSCGLSFLAFLLCIGAGVIGSFAASVFSFLSFIVTAVAVICDFVGLEFVRHKVNEQKGVSANWGVAIWLLLVSAACNLVATLVVFITCCAGRRRRQRRSTKEYAYGH